MDCLKAIRQHNRVSQTERLFFFAHRDLLLDLATTKMMSTARCFDDQPLRADDIFPPSRWRKFLRWVNDAHEAFRKPVGFLKDEQLKDTREMFDETLLLQQIIEANIKHDLYHANEIKRLRKVYKKMQEK